MRNRWRQVPPSRAVLPFSGQPFHIGNHAWLATCPWFYCLNAGVQSTGRFLVSCRAMARLSRVVVADVAHHVTRCSVEMVVNSSGQRCERMVGKAGCATYPPVDANLESAVVMHSTLFQSSLLSPYAVATPFPNCYRTRRGFHFRRLQVALIAAKLGAKVGGVHEKARRIYLGIHRREDQGTWDWRGKTLAKVRAIIHAADPEIVEEWKWVKPDPRNAVWSHGGIVCTGETYQNVVKMTFAKGAALVDPSGLFNSSLGGNVRRAIDIHEGDQVDAAALQDLIRAAVALNLQGKRQSKPRRARITLEDLLLSPLVAGARRLRKGRAGGTGTVRGMQQRIHARLQAYQRRRMDL